MFCTCGKRMYLYLHWLPDVVPVGGSKTISTNSVNKSFNNPAVNSLNKISPDILFELDIFQITNARRCADSFSLGLKAIPSSFPHSEGFMGF